VNGVSLGEKRFHIGVEMEHLQDVVMVPGCAKLLGVELISVTLLSALDISFGGER